MRRNDYLWIFGVNLDTAVRFADPDFLLKCKISAIWRRFPLICAFYMLNAAIFLLSTFYQFLRTLRVITFPIGYHWKCVRGHCACAARDPWVGVEKRLHFWNPRPRFAYSLYNFGGSTMNIIKVICENNARHCVKKVWDSAHARNYVIC